MKRLLKYAQRIPGLKLFRNHVTRQRVGGDWTEYGLGKGSPDYIGWKTISITPDMVGQKVAVFVGLEAKTEDGKPSADQRGWIEIINKAGGLSQVCRNKKDIDRMLAGIDRYHNRGSRGRLFIELKEEDLFNPTWSGRPAIMVMGDGYRIDGKVGSFFPLGYRFLCEKTGNLYVNDKVHLHASVRKKGLPGWRKKGLK